MLKRLFIVCFAALFLIACGGADQPAEEEPAEQPAEEQEAEPATAIAELQPTEGNEVTGTITFTEGDLGVRVTGQVFGLEPETTHGFHVHENGDCSAPDATSAGGHFAPHGAPHGGPDSEEHHVGDLGNIEADGEGTATIDETYEFLSLAEGATNSILGRAVIVHAGEDDLTSQPTGDAGARLACGVINKQ